MPDTSVCYFRHACLRARTRDRTGRLRLTMAVLCRMIYSGWRREFFRPRDIALPPGAYVPGAGIEPACPCFKGRAGYLQPTPDREPAAGIEPA